MANFSLLPLWTYILVVGLMSLIMSLAFVEDATLFQQVPVIGAYLFHVNAYWRSLMQMFFWLFIVVGNTGGALYAGYLAMSSKMGIRDTIKWVLHTELMGILSLRLLKKKCQEMKKSS